MRWHITILYPRTAVSSLYSYQHTSVTQNVINKVTSRLVFMARLRPQVRMPAEHRAKFEFRTCPDPEFLKALHSEFMNTPNVKFLNVPLCSVPMSYLAGNKCGRSLCYGHAAVHWWLQRARGACGRRTALDGGVASILALWRYGQISKCISSVSFVRIELIFL